ncbi:hypothetical protein ACWDKQ_28385 [Saccharopolyspora sp. NPDC000995]
MLHERHHQFLFRPEHDVTVEVLRALPKQVRDQRLVSLVEGTAFTKPVDPILGQAIDAWQASRPPQPQFTDRRTGELVDLLFAFRARRISTAYINNTVIPMLCRKAGVPAADVRAQAVAELSEGRRMATLVAFTATMGPVAADEAIEVFDLLMGDLVRTSGHRAERDRLRTIKELDTAAIALRPNTPLVITHSYPHRELATQLNTRPYQYDLH